MEKFLSISGFGDVHETHFESGLVLAHAHPDYSVETDRITLKSSIVDVEFNGGWFHETREHIHEYPL